MSASSTAAQMEAFRAKHPRLAQHLDFLVRAAREGRLASPDGPETETEDPQRAETSSGAKENVNP